MKTWLSYLLVGSAVAAMAVGGRPLRGTTLRAPWWWSFGSFIATLSVSMAGDIGMVQRDSAWRFLASSSTLCPAVALLGAKRPQDRMWQWIVASLWLIIALPALQQLILNRFGGLEIHPARSWFMLGLILFGVSNSIVSRYGLSVLLAGCGQLGLLGSFLPLPSSVASALSWNWGMIALSGSILLALLTPRKIRSASPFDRAWLDFRNRFGLVWSLRFMEQMNALAKANGWGVALNWSGFRASDGSLAWELPPDQTRVLRQSMNNLLRRFVSPDWIASRLGET
jgi:hypothetical protein